MKQTVFALLIIAAACRDVDTQSKLAVSSEVRLAAKDTALSYLKRNMRTDFDFSNIRVMSISVKDFLKGYKNDQSCNDLDRLISEIKDYPVLQIMSFPTFQNKVLHRKDTGNMVTVYMDTTLKIIDFDCNRGITSTPAMTHVYRSPYEDLYKELLKQEANRNSY